MGYSTQVLFDGCRRKPQNPGSGGQVRATTRENQGPSLSSRFQGDSQALGWAPPPIAMAPSSLLPQGDSPSLSPVTVPQERGILG